MTSSLPPEPPAGGPPPGPGQWPPYGQQPPYGPPPHTPPPGYGPPPGSGYGSPQGYGPHPHAQPASPATSTDLTKLTMAAYVIGAGTVVYLILALFPWWQYEIFAGFGVSRSGFSSGLVSSAFVLFLLATAWAALPAFYDLRLGFPRAWGTVGLAGLGFLLTLFAWIDTFSAGFSIWALLGALVALAIAVFAVFSLLPELRNGPALSGGLAGAAQWANQQAPDLGARGHAAPPQTGAPGYSPPPTGAPGYSPPPPPSAAPPPPYGGGAPGGSTASGSAPEPPAGS